LFDLPKSQSEFDFIIILLGFLAFSWGLAFWYIAVRELIREIWEGLNEV